MNSVNDHMSYTEDINYVIDSKLFLSLCRMPNWFTKTRYNIEGSLERKGQPRISYLDSVTRNLQYYIHS